MENGKILTKGLKLIFNNQHHYYLTVKWVRYKSTFNGRQIYLLVEGEGEVVESRMKKRNEKNISNFTQIQSGKFEM